MKLGIHLPHAGEQATPALIRRHAIRAEALGFDDVWVSEHIIVPRAAFPRSPLFYDPVVTLSYVAAVTDRVRLGTTVLVPGLETVRSTWVEGGTEELADGVWVSTVLAGWLLCTSFTLKVRFAPCRMASASVRDWPTTLGTCTP